ncbi:hypothetical protein HD554DRAFT_2229605 [Boletus coccyginus]|nr:hypothetical protein HD554DRAFT_2229605 [Boletus coccyginus]
MTTTIATKHGRSIRRVQRELHLGHAKFKNKRTKLNAWNAFCWKKHCTDHANKSNDGENSMCDILPDLVKSNRVEYHTLSVDDKENLVKEYSEFKANKAVGQRITARAKINDVTNTLKAIEDELDNLRYHTGIEAILYASRGTTDLLLHRVAFATEGVSGFMGSIVGMEPHTLVSKLEGFAVQGLTGKYAHFTYSASMTPIIGVAKNYKDSDITKDPKATMQWTHYFQNVVSRYQVVIKDWPSTMPFANLSVASSSRAELEMLFRKWEVGTTHWKSITEEEFEALRQERNRQIENGTIQEPTRCPRSDKGKKHAVIDTSTSNNTRHHKKCKRTATVEDNDDDSEGPQDEGLELHLPFCNPELTSQETLMGRPMITPLQQAPCLAGS